MYFDQGKTDLLHELQRRTDAPASVSALAVSVQTDFYSQILFTDTVHVLTRIAGIGDKSFTLEQAIMRGEEECSRSRTVMVAFDTARHESVAVPDPWRHIVGFETKAECGQQQAAARI